MQTERRKCKLAFVRSSSTVDSFVMEQSILSPLRPYVFRYTKKRWFGCRISYYSNSCACFNGMELSIRLSGEIHPLPGPTNTHTILVCMGNRPNHHKPGSRGHVKSNCIEIKPTHSTKAAMHTNQNRCRQHLIENREMVLQNNFDILTISMLRLLLWFK
jgi:hypothetical protein